MRYLIIFLLLCGTCFGQVEFDEVDQGIILDSVAGDTFGAPALTFTAWLTVENIPNDRSAAININNNFLYSILDLLIAYGGTNSIRFGGRSALQSDDSFKYVLVTNAYDVGTRFFIAGLLDYSNDSVLLYKDGTLIVNSNVSFFATTQSQSSSAPVYVGNWNNFDRGIDGTITDARLYTRALSASEIAEIYARPWSLADDTDLVLRTCITTNDTGSALTGVAPNYGTGADGTYSNSPTVAPRKIRIRKPMEMNLP